MIAIVDYHMGNVKSVQNGCEAVGVTATITDNPEDIAKADAIILPGVGAFGEGMERLHSLGLVNVLHDKVLKNKTPFLGICLGLQFIAQRSFEYGEHAGLGWIDGDVVLIEPDDPNCKVPHMGWNSVKLIGSSPLFEGLQPDPTFYFVHSYHLHLRDESVCIASCEHGQILTAAVQKENIYATQFHPEKSQGAGLVVLRNFLQINSHA